MTLKRFLLTAGLAATTTSHQAAQIAWTVHNITRNVTEVSNTGTTVIATSGSDFSLSQTQTASS